MADAAAPAAAEAAPAAAVPRLHRRMSDAELETYLKTFETSDGTQLFAGAEFGMPTLNVATIRNRLERFACGGR